MSGDTARRWTFGGDAGQYSSMLQSLPNKFSSSCRRSLVVQFALICVVATVGMTWSHGFASASTDRNSKNSTSAYPSGCKKVSYTGDGGYYDQGNFYWQPNDTVTLTTHWCYADGVISSHKVTYTTTIPSSLNPQLSLGSSLVKQGAALDVSIGGDYDAGVMNNVGFILIVGHVNWRGHSHFLNEPNAGG